jgi:hypothetical protein
VLLTPALGVTSLLAALLVLSTPHAQAKAPCERTLEVPEVRQVGERCLLASTQAVAAYFSKPLSAYALAKEIPHYPQGTDIFELIEALPTLGFDALMLRAEVDVLGRLIEAGMPMIVMVRQGKRKHALVTRGLRRAVSKYGHCGPISALEVMDPRYGTTRWMRVSALRTAQDLNQVVLIMPQEMKRWSTLEKVGLDLKKVKAQDARFRAQGFLRQVSQHTEMKHQALHLARRAVKADPCWKEAWDIVRRIETKLGVTALTAMPVACEKRP